MKAPLRVLHLEDNPRDAKLVRDRLDAAGVPCNILVVSNKEGFETALAQEPFSLILLDHNLPDYDGITALKHAQHARPEVPVIIISGTVGDEDAVKCLQVGATDYLLKDRLDRLGPAVERAIEDAQMRVTRKRAEVALAESESRKAAILDSVLDSIITMDADGLVIEFNAAAERTFAYTKAQAVGRAVVDLIVPPEFRNAHNAGLAHYRATKEAPLLGKVIEISAVRSDGLELPIELVVTAVQSDGATIFTGVLRDITARKRAEAEIKRLNDEIQLQRLREIEIAQKRATVLEQQIAARRQAEAAVRDERDRAQRYLDTAEVILLALDNEGRITLANRYACSLLGWTADELLGRNWADTCLPPRVRDDLNKKFINLLGGDSPVVENLVVTKSGEERLIEWRNTVQRDDAGQTIGTFSSGADVTERNHAVEALQTAEERMRFALESAGVGIWDMDFVTGALRWSRILEAQYGVPAGTFAGTLDAFIERVHPDDRPSLLDTLGKANRSGSDFPVQHRSVWPDGTVRWLVGSGRIHLGRNGEPVRGVGITMDLTERHALEEQYQQAQKMEAIGQLAGGVAHDFNNLLTIILGNCELLLDELDLDVERQANLAEIHKAGQSAAGLTRRLLAFSRKEIIQPTLLDLNVVMVNMQPMLRRLIREDVEIVLGVQPEAALIEADPGQIEQIVLNLAVNARDAMPNGGTLTIDIASVELDEQYAKTHLAVVPGRYVRMTAADTGGGMTPEVQLRLFEPFFTTKGVGQGTGLGLATVHGIVTQSGGTIDVTSEVGKGTSFKVYFPMAKAAGEKVVEVSPLRRRPLTRPANVLLVEDAAGLRLLTTKLLHRHGHKVLVAANADQAVELFEENPDIDVLLTDVVMPGGSGPELTRRLVERRPELKVVYMSGYTDEAIVHHGVLEPGIAFIHKPFTSKALARKIREVLDD